MVRIICEQCRESGYLQRIGNYYRIRHYDTIVDGKSTFHYHQVSKQYAEKCLSEIKDKTVSESRTENLTNGQSGQELTIEHLNTIDHLEKPNLALESENKDMRSSSSWLGHKPSKLAIPGSNPGDRTKHFHYRYSQTCLKHLTVKIAPIAVSSGSRRSYSN